MDFLRRLRRWTAMRLIFVLARWARDEGGSVANRVWFVVRLPERVELRAEWRRLDGEDGYTREEVLRMLETVRAAERRMEWTCPEPEPASPPPRRRPALPPDAICACPSCGASNNARRASCRECGAAL